eukprot:2831992-Rhodomonas_salina.1
MSPAPMVRCQHCGARVVNPCLPACLPACLASRGPATREAKEERQLTVHDRRVPVVQERQPARDVPQDRDHELPVQSHRPVVHQVVLPHGKQRQHPTLVDTERDRMQMEGTRD